MSNEVRGPMEANGLASEQTIRGITGMANIEQACQAATGEA
jgi:hypothetical protein